MRVVHLTSAHPVFDNRIFLKECRSLAAAGHDVALVVPHPRDEVVEGIRILGVTRAGGRLKRFTRVLAQVYRRAVNERADVYHLHDPELIPVGLALRARGAMVVVDLHEDLPDQILTKPWIPQPLRRAVSGLVASGIPLLGRSVDQIVAATPAIASRFGERAAVVNNFPMLEERVVGTPVAREREPLFVYVGKLTPLRGGVPMVEAVNRLDATLNPRLVIAGDIVPAELRSHLGQVDREGRTTFAGYLDRVEASRLVGRSRAGLVLFHPAPNHVTAQPNKLFEYMSQGVPVIASAFPLWREIIEGVGCGLTVDPEDPEAIAGAMARLLADPEESAKMGQRGQDAIDQRFNWPREAEKLVAVYDRLERSRNHRRSGLATPAGG